MRFTRVVALLFSMALVKPANALPTMIRLGYVNCVACHIAPQGGGPLNAYGRSIDVVRSESARRRREEREARLAGDTRGVMSDSMDDMATRQEVRDALECLRDTEREAIALAYFFGFSYREVASELGIPEGTIKNRIRKGLERLRTQLTVDEPVPVI